jgi:hypothetical protein
VNKRVGGALAALLAAAVLIVGCSRSSTGPNPEPGDVSEYKPRTNPENVLYNIEKAYANMDAEAYLDGLAEGYIFFLNPEDINNPEHPLPEYWDKIEERVIHERMFADDSGVEGVTLDFTHLDSIWDQGSPGDWSDDLWTFIEGVDLRIQLPPDLTLHAEAPAEFLFRVDPDSTGPNGEILWEIWKQWDLSADGRDTRRDGRSDTSWGAIKAMFR